jgi:hypothetical protein
MVVQLFEVLCILHLTHFDFNQVILLPRKLQTPIDSAVVYFLIVQLQGAPPTLRL